MTFIEKLVSLQQSRQSWLCLGLDPDAELMPAGIDVLTFNRRLIDATADLVSSYKLNLAFYMAFGLEGWNALEKTLAHIPTEIPVLLDAKFGDTGHTAKQYAKAAYDALKVDAVTASPYIGLDGILPLLDYPGKMVFVLVRSTNTVGNDFQLWPRPDSPLFRYVTGEVNTLGRKYPDQIGLGVAATHSDLARVRSWAPALPFLIPGIGVQGGSLEDAVTYGGTRTVGPLVNITRAIIYAGQGQDFDQAARGSAEAWLKQIRDLRQAARSRAHRTGEMPTVP